MIPKFGSHTLGTGTSTEKDIKNLLGNEVEFGFCHVQENIEDGCKENEGCGDAIIQTMQKTGELDESCNRNAGMVLGHKSHGLSEMHEKPITLIQKVAPTDMLWDGYLQLNSSVTFSAVAFFKSGEKMPDVKWSESVEVKGKVKLDAFEKYIQDLSRSRNRGLMVVSLRWKEGSSKLGLAGMKKVAKRYEEGERVGLARLLSGIDLYVCPRSETIITILARYGFFKGRTAIEENKDSLIGCVVWRRNQINVNSVHRKSENFTHQATLSNKSPTPLPSEESLESSQKNHTAVDVTKQKDIIEKDKTLSVSPQRLHNCYQEHENQQVPVGQPSILELHENKSEVKEQDLNFSQPRPILVLQPPHVVKQPPILDSEDLPEFDFRMACGLVPSQLLNSQSADKKLFHKGFRHMESCPTLHKRRLENVIDQQVLSDGDTHSMPLQKKVCRHDNISQSPLVKSRFNDDDMPEWCPPDVDVEKQSNLVTVQPPKVPISAVKPNLVHSNQVADVQNLFSPARVVVDRPPFSNQNSHFTFLGPVNVQKHAKPGPPGIQIGKVLTSRGHQL